MYKRQDLPPGIFSRQYWWSSAATHVLEFYNGKVPGLLNYAVVLAQASARLVKRLVEKSADLAYVIIPKSVEALQRPLTSLRFKFPRINS